MERLAFYLGGDELEGGFGVSFIWFSVDIGI